MKYLTEPKVLNAVLKDMDNLNKKVELLNEILGYYNPETMTFDIPDKWKPHNVRKDKLPAESPRHRMFDKIYNALSEEELANIGIYGYNY